MTFISPIGCAAATALSHHFPDGH